MGYVLLSDAFMLFPLALSSVLLLSGTGKLGRTSATQAALRQFRMPPPLQGRLPATALPLIEIALGVALLLATPPWFAAVGALVLALFAAFFIASLVAVLRGDLFECGCFGRLGTTSRVGPGMVLRNGVFLLVATLTAIIGAAGFPGALTTMLHLTIHESAWLSISAGLAVGAFALGATIRGGAAHNQNGRRVQAVTAVGERIPSTQLVTASGDIVDIHQIVSIRPAVLVFVRPGCGSCDELIESLDPIARSLAGLADVIVAVDSPRTAFASTHPTIAVSAFYGIQALKERLGIIRTPAAAVIGLNSVLAATPATGLDAIRQLLGDTPHLVTL